jgi:hypothetical protein
MYQTPITAMQAPKFPGLDHHPRIGERAASTSDAPTRGNIVTERKMIEPPWRLRGFSLHCEIPERWCIFGVVLRFTGLRDSRGMPRA